MEAKEDKEAVMLELEQLANYKAELHSSCDFVMKNFEIRQTASWWLLNNLYGTAILVSSGVYRRLVEKGFS